MSHEQSETVERDGRHYNISGVTGKDLPPKYPFEKSSYATQDEAVSAAKRRSQTYGQQHMSDSLDNHLLAQREGNQIDSDLQFLQGLAGAPVATAPAEPQAKPAEKKTEGPGVMDTLKKSFMEHPHVKGLGKILELDQVVGGYLKGLSLGEPGKTLTAEEWVDKSYPGGVDQFIEKTAKEQGVNAAAIGPAIRKTFADLITPLGLAFSPLLQQGGKAIKGAMTAKPAPPKAGAPASTTGPQTAQGALPAEVAAPAPIVKSVKKGEQADPDAIVIGDRAVSVNLEAIQGPEDVQKAIKSLAGVHRRSEGGPSSAGLPRGTKPIPDATAKYLAQSLGRSEDELLEELRGQSVTVEEMIANADLLNAGFRGLQRIAAEVKAGGDPAALNDMMTKYLAIGQATTGKGTEAAQTLRIMGQEPMHEEIGTFRAFAQQLEMAKAAGNLTDEALAEVILRTDASQFAKIVTSSNGLGWDVFQELLYGSMLSNPATHVTNLIGSGFITPAMAIMERALATRGGEVAGGEAMQMLYGYLHGVGRAITAVRQTYTTGGFHGVIDAIEAAGPSKIETRFNPAITADNFNLQSSILAPIVNTLGALVRIPTQALKASDAFMRAINFDMEAGALAYREGKRLGKEGADLKAYIDGIVANPPMLVKEQATKFAAVQTFTNHLTPRMSNLQQAVDHPAWKIVFPFIRTPTNIFKYGFEHMPIVNLIGSAMRADLKAGGARGDIAQAKMVFGGTVAGLGASLAMGEQITGNGPLDPDIRRVWLRTHKPYSIKVGDDWMSFNRLDPVAGLFGLVADMAGMRGEINDDDYGQMTGAIGLSIARNIGSKTYLQGLNELMDVVGSGGDAKEKFRKFERFFEKHVVSATPGVNLVGSAGVAAINRAFFDDQLREVSTALEQLQSRVPGWSKDLPARLDFFGEPVFVDALGPDLLSPISQERIREDPVAAEIVKQWVPVEFPGRFLDGVELSSQEHHDFVKAFANPEKTEKGGALMQGKNLHDMLAEVIKEPRYVAATDGPDGMKADFIKQWANGYRALAKQRLLETHPDLKAKIDTRAQGKTDKLIGVQAPQQALPGGFVAPALSQ